MNGLSLIIHVEKLVSQPEPKALNQALASLYGSRIVPAGFLSISLLLVWLSCSLCSLDRHEHLDLQLVCR